MLQRADQQQRLTRNVKKRRVNRASRFDIIAPVSIETVFTCVNLATESLRGATSLNKDAPEFNVCAEGSPA